MPTVEETFEALKSRFIAEKAAGANGVIQWEISGDGGGAWHAVIKDGTCTINQGPASKPDVTLKLSAQDWIDLNLGKTAREVLFLTGRLKMKGDLVRALTLGSLFRKPGS